MKTQVSAAKYNIQDLQGACRVPTEDCYLQLALNLFRLIALALGVTSQ